jgi:Cupin domain
MHHVRQENLPFVGSSHEFVGAEQGDTGVSVFLFHGKPGSGPGPHRHPYDEIQFIREGRGVWTVNGKTFEAEINLAGEPVSRILCGARSLLGACCGDHSSRPRLAS